MAVTLPVNPSASAASVGKDFLLYINTGTAQTPTWTLVGGQRNLSISRTADEIDLSSKTSPWKAAKTGLKSWSADIDSLTILSDTGVQALEQAFMTSTEINVKFHFPDGSNQSGWGYLTDLSLDTPHDGEASVTCTIMGNGALSDRTPTISPLAVTVSTAGCDEQTFTITPSSTTVSSVKDNGSALTVTTHYTYSAGTLVILDDYLDGKAIGVHTFTVTTGGGENITFVVNITA